MEDDGKYGTKLVVILPGFPPHNNYAFGFLFLTSSLFWQYSHGSYL